MIYLVISILAAIVLVGLVIRRLPYLRSPHIGVNITIPRPYLAKTSVLTDWWNRMQLTLQGLLRRPRPYFPSESPTNPLVHQSYTPPSVTAKPADTSYLRDGIASTAYPGDFWQDEPVSATGPLELPSQGLITRRGESQKIAHELIVQADESFRKKDYKSAEKYYLQAATKDPENPRIYNRLGVIYLNTKNYKDATDAFRRALKFDDRVASRHFNLGLAYLGKRDYRSAEKCFKEAISLEPTNDKYRKTLEAIQKQTA